MFSERVLQVEQGFHATAVNPTMFERLDHSYSMHYTSLPFECFYNAVEFSKKSGISQALIGVVKVKESCFQETPLLANCVQQFAVWVQAVQEVLQPMLDQPKPTFTFKMFCSDALHFCQLMQAELSLSKQQEYFISPAFDTIHSSNLIDSISLPSLVLSAIQLLKNQGLLFTTTFQYKHIAPTADQYLKTAFGFKCELLPLVCGVHIRFECQ